MKANKPLTPIRAIREHCLECQGFSPLAVRECQSKCRFSVYRLGTQPFRKGIGGFKTHRINCPKPTQVASYSVGLCDSGSFNAIYPAPLKPFIADEVAEKMIKAANSIIEITNSLKSS